MEFPVDAAGSDSASGLLHRHDRRLAHGRSERPSAKPLSILIQAKQPPRPALAPYRPAASTSTTTHRPVLGRDAWAATQRGRGGSGLRAIPEPHQDLRERELGQWDHVYLPEWSKGAGRAQCCTGAAAPGGVGIGVGVEVCGSSGTSGRSRRPCRPCRPCRFDIGWRGARANSATYADVDARVTGTARDTDPCLGGRRFGQLYHKHTRRLDHDQSHELD